MPKPGWLARQFEQIARESKTWPLWMRPPETRRPKGQGTELETTVTVSSEEQKAAVTLALDERRYQDAKWGGAGFDDTQSPGDWSSYIIEYATGTGRAANYSFAKRMQKVAALGLAALESQIRGGNFPE